MKATILLHANPSVRSAFRFFTEPPLVEFRWVSCEPSFDVEADPKLTVLVPTFNFSFHTQCVPKAFRAEWSFTAIFTPRFVRCIESLLTCLKSVALFRFF